MAEEPAALVARKRIEQVLNDFVHNRAEAKVVVVRVDELGHLQAVVASQAFDGMSHRERHDSVRDYLRQHARPEDLAHLYRVFVMSTDEFRERYSFEAFAGGETEILRLGMKDQEGADE